jgi:hypothetical protein
VSRVLVRFGLRVRANVTQGGNGLLQFGVWWAGRAAHLSAKRSAIHGGRRAQRCKERLCASSRLRCREAAQPDVLQCVGKLVTVVVPACLRSGDVDAGCMDLHARPK